MEEASFIVSRRAATTVKAGKTVSLNCPVFPTTVGEKTFESWLGYLPAKVRAIDRQCENLLECKEFQSASLRIQQQAIWLFHSNLSRTQLVGVIPNDRMPLRKELTSIQTLFAAGKVDRSDRQVFVVGTDEQSNEALREIAPHNGMAKDPNIVLANQFIDVGHPISNAAIKELQVALKLLQTNPDEARRGLTDVVEKYPSTYAAREAQGVLEYLRSVE